MSSLYIIIIIIIVVARVQSFFSRLARLPKALARDITAQPVRVTLIHV